ncbi:TPA: NTP transferase domain-containing protein, partial [Neisseria meningitidis]
MNTENLKTVIVVPARYASTRLPGKPLADICGKPMIQHVYERACKVPYIDDVIVAVDDRRVAEVVESFGGKVIMTSTQHDSGTDRLVEVMGKYAAD